MMNPFKVLSKKVVDATLATEVQRLREMVRQQELAIGELLARETMYLAAVTEICEEHDVKDNEGNVIVSQAGFCDYACNRAKVQS